MSERNEDAFPDTRPIRTAIDGLVAATPTTRAAHLTILEAALKVAEAEEFVRHIEQRAARARRRKTMPPDYEPLKGKRFENGFRAPDGSRFGWWVVVATMREEAWNHYDDPDEFEDPRELEQLDGYKADEHDELHGGTAAADGVAGIVIVQRQGVGDSAGGWLEAELLQRRGHGEHRTDPGEPGAEE